MPRRSLPFVLALLLAVAACAGGSEVSTTTSTQPAPATTKAPSTTTTTTLLPAPIDTQAFLIPKGEDGVTFLEDGDPPSGPSSFTVMDDGSVVVADTNAFTRGEPRLLRFDRTGIPIAVIDLATEEVASIVDVVSNEGRLAILDVFIAMDRYRVLIMSEDGVVERELEIPVGYRFEDGLTGLLWDDSGILLEFEFGVRFARINEDGSIEDDVLPRLGGLEVSVSSSEGETATVAVGSSQIDVPRPSDLGGVRVLGLASDGSITVLLDEVDLSGPAIRVVQHVRRYDADGRLTAWYAVELGTQFVEIDRAWELGADGGILFMAATSEGARITTESELPAMG